MTENCPNCGYDLSNFFRKKIENNLKKEFEEKNKKLLSQAQNPYFLIMGRGCIPTRK